MAALSRVTQKLFGSTAGAGEIGKFGSFAAGTPVTTTDPAVIQALSQFLDGWFAAILADDNPAIEDMNALFFLAFRQIAYVLEAGVPAWDSGTTYYTNEMVSSGGYIYVSLTDTNLNNAVSDQTKWKPIDGLTRTATATGNLSADDKTVIVNNTGGAATMTLPAVASTRIGHRITLKRSVTSTSNVTLKGNSSENINAFTAANTLVLTVAGSSVTVENNGSSWEVV